MITSAYASGIPLDKHWVTDSLDNRLQLNSWTMFTKDNQFLHPNGNLYPGKGFSTTWVYTTPYKQNRFQGWLGFAGIVGGIYDAHNRGYLDSWRHLGDVRDFSLILGSDLLWGLALDSPDPNACKYASVLTALVGGPVMAYHFGWFNKEQPTAGEARLIAGCMVSSWFIGKLLDNVRTIPPRNVYRYRVRGR